MPIGSSACKGTAAHRRACRLATASICSSSPSARSAKKRRGWTGESEAVVDDPGPRLDPGAAQILSQARGFENRSGFGQGDDDHLGALLVLQLHQRGGEIRAGLTDIARHFVGDMLPSC